MQRQVMILAVAATFGAFALSGCERNVDRDTRMSQEQKTTPPATSPRADSGYSIKDMEPKAPPVSSEEALKNPAPVQGQVDPRQPEQKREFERKQ